MRLEIKFKKTSTFLLSIPYILLLSRIYLVSILGRILTAFYHLKKNVTYRFVISFELFSVFSFKQ